MRAFDSATERSEKTERGAAESSVRWLEPTDSSAYGPSQSLH